MDGVAGPQYWRERESDHIYIFSVNSLCPIFDLVLFFNSFGSFIVGSTQSSAFNSCERRQTLTQTDTYIEIDTNAYEQSDFSACKKCDEHMWIT